MGPTLVRASRPPGLQEAPRKGLFDLLYAKVKRMTLFLLPTALKVLEIKKRLDFPVVALNERKKSDKISEIAP